MTPHSTLGPYDCGLCGPRTARILGQMTNDQNTTRSSRNQNGSHRRDAEGAEKQMTNDQWPVKNDKWQFVVRTSDFYLSLFICHLSLDRKSLPDCERFSA